MQGSPGRSECCISRGAELLIDTIVVVGYQRRQSRAVHSKSILSEYLHPGLTRFGWLWPWCCNTQYASSIIGCTLQSMDIYDVLRVGCSRIDTEYTCAMCLSNTPFQSRTFCRVEADYSVPPVRAGCAFRTINRSQASYLCGGLGSPYRSEHSVH